MYAIQNRKMLFGDNEHTSSVKAGTFLERFNASQDVWKFPITGVVFKRFWLTEEYIDTVSLKNRTLSVLHCTVQSL
jgi:hypothetical protein